MNKKKYMMLSESIEMDGHILYRIQALVPFSDVQAGQMGGFIESEENLSHDGLAWIYDDACACDGSRVYGDAQLRNRATIRDNAQAYDSAVLEDDSLVDEEAEVYGRARMRGCSRASGTSCIYDDVELIEDAHARGNSRAYGSTILRNQAVLDDNARAYGSVDIGYHAMICGDARVSKNTHWFHLGFLNATFFFNKFGGVSIYSMQDEVLYDSADFIHKHDFGELEVIRPLAEKACEMAEAAIKI